jgi:hypothetical protein
MMKYESKIIISNSSTRPKKIYLEPWAEEFEMSSGKTFELFAKAEEEGNFEVEFNDDNITVYLWPGSTVKVYCEGEELGAGNFERQSVPDIPKGQNISSFLGILFGKDK